MKLFGEKEYIPNFYVDAMKAVLIPFGVFIMIFVGIVWYLY